MDEESVAQHILALPDVRFDTSPDGARFFFYGDEKMFPFATLVNSNAHDQVSDLDRPGVFRVNVGVGKETFKSLVPDEDADHDYTAFDCVMPHPDYARLGWVCIVNPSDEMFESTVRGLIAEAYDTAVAKDARREQSTQRREG